VSLAALDVNLLVMLDAVLAEGSVARAAQRMHVTPSAISNGLARLRVALGDPLVVRRGRGIVPTPRAAALAPAMTRALRDLEQAIGGAAFDASTTTRVFTLAIADAGQVVRLPRIASLLSGEMPSARLRVVGIDSLVSLGGLGGAEVDVAIGPGEAGPGIRMELLFEEQVVLVARRDHPACRSRLSRSAVAKLRHVAVEMAPGARFRDLAALAFTRAGVPREVAVAVPSFAAAAAVVAATNLVASLPASLVDFLSARLGLASIRGAVPSYSVPMKMCWHERTHADPGMIAFRSAVRRATTTR